MWRELNLSLYTSCVVWSPWDGSEAVRVSRRNSACCVDVSFADNWVKRRSSYWANIEALNGTLGSGIVAGYLRECWFTYLGT